MTKTTRTYDVLITGGGLAGLSLSCLLGQAGVAVACIEQAAPKALSAADIRTTAISFGSQAVLEKAGVWDALKDIACPIEDIRILDGSSPVLLHFLSDEVGGRAFGWIVENANLRKALISRVKTLKNVAHITPATVTDFEVAERGVTAILQGGGKIKAALAVGADGRNSFMRDWMGVQTRGWNYGQRAIVSIAHHENPHHNVAVEHFWPEGPFAILPMTDSPDGTHRSSVVFTEHGPEKNSLMGLSDQAFEIALQSRFPVDYGTVTLAGKRAAFPLSLVHAAQYIAPRMALLADAAHGIHPVAGQGLNLGFRDVQGLAELIVAAKTQAADMGGDALLQAYQRQRRPDNMAMVAVTDALVRLFSNNITPIRLLRKAGLRAVSRIPAAKQFFMRRAMGDF